MHRVYLHSMHTISFIYLTEFYNIYLSGWLTTTVRHTHPYLRGGVLRVLGQGYAIYWGPLWFFTVVIIGGRVVKRQTCDHEVTNSNMNNSYCVPSLRARLMSISENWAVNGHTTRCISPYPWSCSFDWCLAETENIAALWVHKAREGLYFFTLNLLYVSHNNNNIMKRSIIT